ncbi:MAG: MFS transporter [Pseudomonadota bacterium]
MVEFYDPAPGSHRRWVMFAVGSINFVISMFYRVSTAVISPTLIREMGLTTAQLSDLSAAFYYAFALFQVPLGIALARLGPRITMAFLGGCAVGGAVLFATGETAERLVLARVLLGIGMSGNLMVLLALVAAWFPVNRFGFLSGSAVAVGTLGNILAATPLAALCQWVGWRWSFLLFAGINAAIVAAFVVTIRDRPESGRSSGRKKPSLFGGLRRLLRMYGYWAISIMNFVRYGYISSLQSLWLVPFLILGLGYDEMDAGNALLAMSVGYMVGLPLWGALSDRVLRSRKWTVVPNTVCYCLLVLTICFWTEQVSFLLVTTTCFLLGTAAASGQVSYAHIKELVPASMSAQALTSVNLFTTLGGGAMIHVLGMLLGKDPSNLMGPAGYRPLWVVGFVLLAGVSLLYLAVPDSRFTKAEDA